FTRSRSETTSEHAPTVARHRDDPGPLLALRDVQPELRFEASRTEARNAHVGVPLVRRTPRHYQGLMGRRARRVRGPVGPTRPGDPRHGVQLEQVRPAVD